MATYVNNLRLKEITTGDEDGTWGTSTNTNLELIGEALGYNTQDCFATDANATTTVADGATDPARALYFKVTSSATLTATRTLTIGPNTVSRVMWIENATTGSQSIEISQGSGANVTIATGETALLYLDGAGATASVVAIPLDSSAVTLTGTQTLTNKTLTAPKVGTSVNDTNGAELIKVTATSSAVNEVTLANAATGNNPTLSATGDDTNVGLNVTPKGTGQFDVTASFMTGIFSDKVSALGNTGTSQTITSTNGQVFTATLTGNCTFTLASANSNSNQATSFTLILTNDATPSRTVAFAGGTFLYPGGSVSRSTGANETDIWFFFSPDGGTNWYVTLPAKNFS